MSIALDIGSHQMRSLRQEAGTLVVRRVPAVYAVVPGDASHPHSSGPAGLPAAQCRMLDEARIPYGVCDAGLLLLGESAVEVAQLFDIPVRPLFAEGRLPDDDPLVRQIVASLIESLMPLPKRSGEICCLTLPAASLGHATPEMELFTQVLRLHGYTPLLETAGHAVVLAELVDDRFTGIGMVFGRSSCEAVVARHGVEVARCVIDKGGDWIDRQFAGFSQSADAPGHADHSARDIDAAPRQPGGDPVDAARRRKEAFRGSIAAPDHDSAHRLAWACRRLCTELLDAVRQELTRPGVCQQLPSTIRIATGGGTARIPGFAELLHDSVVAASLPVDVSEVLLAADPAETVLRGCLINAHLEDQTRSHRRAA